MGKQGGRWSLTTLREKLVKIGVDETASASDRLLGRMAKMKPQPKSAKPTRTNEEPDA